MHYDLSVIAIVGIILLIGIVKKNGIMLVDFALEAERSEGLTPEESIYRACMLRFRPILMTTMAALLGGVPMMLGTGVGSEIRQPLGYAIVGGLLSVADSDALYDAGRLYLSRPAEPSPGPAPPRRAKRSPRGRYAASGRVAAARAKLLSTIIAIPGSMQITAVGRLHHCLLKSNLGF